jgi:hypothetical protein
VSVERLLVVSVERLLVVLPRHKSVRRRPDRDSPPTTGLVDGPFLLPGAQPPAPHTPHPGEGEWTLGHRARQPYLDPEALAGDLARIGLPVPASRLAAILAGDEPAPPVVLAGLVDVLELRDPAVGYRPLLTAVAQPWSLRSPSRAPNCAWVIPESGRVDVAWRARSPGEQGRLESGPGHVDSLQETPGLRCLLTCRVAWVGRARGEAVVRLA